MTPAMRSTAGSISTFRIAETDRISLGSEADGIASLMIDGRGWSAIFSQASNDVGRPIPRQDLRSIGLEAAFELLDLPGTAPFRWHRGFPDPHHANWRAIGFELQFILFAVCTCR